MDILQMVVIFLAIEVGAALQCYKCPSKMKDVFHCSDPYQNVNFESTCSNGEDVCLKISARGSGNHIEERGCAKKSSVSKICDGVIGNFGSDSVECAVCDTDLCNGSVRFGATTTWIFLLPACLNLIKSVS